MTTEQLRNQDDPSINVFMYLSVLFKYKYLFVFSLVMGVLFAALFNYQISTPQYEGRITFISSESVASQGGLASYAQLLGKGTSDANRYIQIILDSNQFKYKLSEQLLTKYFETAIKEALQKQEILDTHEAKVNYVTRLLNYKQNLTWTIDKNSLYTLTFKSVSPHLTHSILSEIPNVLSDVNTSLNFLINKDTIIIVDNSQLPDFPAYPKVFLNFILIPFLFLLGSLLIISVYRYVVYVRSQL